MKVFPSTAALESYGPDYRFRTPVYRVGPVSDGRLRGALSLVAQGELSFGLRDRKGGTLAYADGGATTTRPTRSGSSKACPATR